MVYTKSVAHTEEFDAPASAVWGLLADWGGIADWMPAGNIQSLQMEGQGIGAIRHLVTPQGVNISEQLDTLDEESGILELSIIEPLPWGMLSYTARGTVARISDKRCRLTWRGTFATPESGSQSNELAHLLKKLYSTMFLGLRRETENRQEDHG